MPYPVNLDSVLEKTLDNLGLFQKARKYQVFALWPRLVGKLSKHAQPRRTDGDVLYVATSSSVWSQELSYMSQDILTRINRALGGEYFREIRFSENLWRSAARKIRPGGIEVDAFKKSLLISRGARNGRSRSLCQTDLDVVLQSFKRAMDMRKEALLAKGFVSCRECGCLYPVSKKECPFCKTRKELSGYNRVIAILEERPEIPNDEVCRVCGVRDTWVAERAKHELESRWVTIIGSRLARITRKEARGPETVEYLRKLASLRSGMRARDMSPKDLERVLGKRLAILIPKG